MTTMNQNPIFKAALGMIWESRRWPSMDEKIALRHEAYHLYDANALYTKGEIPLAAEVLKICGYPVALNAQGNWELPAASPPTLEDVPSPGHIIEAGTPWNGCSLLALQGSLNTPRPGYPIATAKGGWHVTVGERGIQSYSMGCGGPASISRLDISKLMPTGRTGELTVWDFAMRPEAHTAVYFKVEVPIWHWTPSEGDFI